MLRIFFEQYGLETCFLVTFVLLIWIGIRIKRDYWNHILFNLGAIFLAFGIYELSLTIRSIPDTTLTRDLEYFQPDTLLGYSAIGLENLEVNVLKMFTDSGDTIYYTQYGFEHGYRKTPKPDTVSSYALFLGGSFAFGEGVSDHETLPFYFAQIANDVQVMNYGFHGYGPHQVLMQLRHRVFKEGTMHKGKSGCVYYLFIPPHIGRAHGRTDWDKTGPYFYMDEDSLVWGGTFYDKRVKTSRWKNILQTILFKSRIYNLHLRGYIESSHGELKLILSLISAMKKEVDVHDLEFRVILDYHAVHKELVEKIKRGLDRADVLYLDTYDAIPFKKMDDPNLYIKGDLHPTPKFHLLLADYLHTLYIKGYERDR